MATAKNIAEYVDAISKARGLSPAEVRNAIEEAAKSVFPSMDVEVELGCDMHQPGIYRYITAGKEISVANAQKYKPSVIDGDLVRVPMYMSDGTNRKFRWMVNKHLADAETYKLYRQWTRAKGRAVIGAVIGPNDNGDVYVDLGNATGVLERRRMIPKEQYTRGREFMFLIARVSLEIKTGGRLVIILSRNSIRLVDAMLRQMAPGIGFRVEKRVAGARCVVVIKGMDSLPKGVVANVSRLLGEFIQIKKDNTGGANDLSVAEL